MSDGAKIFNGNETSAREMLAHLIVSFPKVRSDLENAYQELDISKFHFLVHKFYSGALYVGVPALRQAINELLMALIKQEKHSVQHLYQNMLDEMIALENEILERNFFKNYRGDEY
jgi:HPt (histidine-containing phosphotransfer) domain-containing protein